MLNKLGEAEKKFDEIGEKLAGEEATADMEEYRRLMKEYKTLTPIVEKYREYKKHSADLEGAKQLMTSEDKEIKELAARYVEEFGHRDHPVINGY